VELAEQRRSIKRVFCENLALVHSFRGNRKIFLAVLKRYANSLHRREFALRFGASVHGRFSFQAHTLPKL
jgi:hypothetical protein